MATSAPLSEKAPEETGNPGQELADKEFNPDRRAAGNPTDPRSNDTAAGDPSDPRGKLRDKEQTATKTEHENQVGSGYRQGQKQPSRFSLRAFSKKRAAFGGGIIGTIVIILMFFFASGPLEFVHIAQLLERFHFSAQQDQSDDRFLQEARYVRYKASGAVYKSNLGVFQNYIANQLEARLGAAGIEPVYNNGSFGVNRDGWLLDPEKLSTSEFEDFSGKSPAEIKQYFNDKYPGVNAQVVTSGENAGKIFIDEANINSSLFGHSTFSNLSRLFLKSTGMNTVTSAESARIMSKRAGSTWHPISRARNIALSKFADWVKGWIKSMRDGTNTSIDQTAQEDTNPTDQAIAEKIAETGENPVETPVGEGTALKPGDPQTNEGLSLKAKISSGGLAALTVSCVLKSIDSDATHIKEAKVAYPLMREATAIIGLGNQVMSGQDLTAQQAGYFKHLLDGPSTQSDNPNTQTSWYDAASIQAELGNNSGGVPASGTLTALNQNSPFHFLNTGLTGATLSAPCGIIDSAAGQVAGAVAAPELSLFTYIVSQIGAVKHLFDDAVLWASGQPLNMFDRGADFGNDINFGSRLAANAQAVSSGGRMLSSADSSQLTLYESNQSQVDFQSHGIAYRLLNPYDERSAVSQFIDQQNPDPRQGLHNIASAMLKFSNIFASLPKLFTKPAQAVSAPYNYGFPEYGFSVDEMNNPLVRNPYKNADDVISKILPAHPEYIKRIQDCFGVTIDPATYNITSLGTDPLDPDSSAAISMNFFQQPGAAGYNSACADTGSTWMQVRFYIFDTQTMASATCYLGDNTDSTTQQACSMVGNDQSVTTGSEVSSSSGSCDGGGEYSALVGSNSSFAGVDQGIDFVPSNSSGFDICAPASGTIVQADASGHHFDRTTGQAEVILKMDQPSNAPNSGGYIYFIEIVQIDSSVRVGMHVDKGTIIGHNAQSPGIEVGWASGSGGPGSGLQPACGVSDSATVCGRSFNDWVLAGGGT